MNPKKQSRAHYCHIALSLSLAGLLSVIFGLTDTRVWKSSSSAHATLVNTAEARPPIRIATFAQDSVKPRSPGAIIAVSPPDQKPPQQVGGHGCSLVEAIYAANFDDNVAIDSTNPDHFITTECTRGNGDDTIELPAGSVFQMSVIIADAHNYMGPTATPIIFSNITINANGSRIERIGNLNIRAFSIGSASVDAPGGTVSGTGHLTINNAHIKGFKAKGGNGGAGGGGGGMGAGGAIYVNGGGLTVEGSTFESNSATGGNGNTVCCGAGGGGGGMGGNGGNAGNGSSFTGGGGGGGSRGNGGSGGDEDEFGEAGGGGGGGTVTSGDSAAQSSNGGFNCGGDGGVGGGVILSGSDGDDGSCPGGGGGGGGSRFNSISGTSGNGGNGKYGGGGGGSGYDFANGGSGGFGGGGAGSTFFPSGGGDGTGGAGGNGGFGAGGGAGADDPGHGGDFGGNADKQNGGGGAGLGGAIFNDGGTIDIRNSTFVSNEAITSTGTRPGQAAGGAILSRNGSLTLLNSTLAGNRARTPDFFGENASGIFVLGDGTTASFILRNTINYNAFAADCVVFGAVTSDGSGNLVGSNMGCPGVVISSDPLLGPFQINPPGNTPTLAIPSNSPAFNAGDNGNCLQSDQRGVMRPQFAACDIGAYEVDCIAFAMTCPTNKTQANDPGQCGAVVTYPTPEVTGDCTPVCNPASGSFFPAGTTTVSCTADIARCSFTVTVNDSQPPAIACPASIIAANDTNQCGAVISYQSPTVSDNCSGVGAPACIPAAGSFFPKGITTVSCTVSDASSNSASCSFTVRIDDTQAPTISCPANMTRPNDTNQCGAVVSYAAPAVTDNCPSVGAPVCSPASGSFFPKGATTVVCNVTDASGNSSGCSFTVTIDDTQPPVITGPASINTAATVSCPIATSAPVTLPITATDNCPGVMLVCKDQNNVVVTSGSVFPVGTTTLTCTATDSSSNTTVRNFSINVFSFCLQDDSNPGNVALVNAQTGDFSFCCGGVLIASGRGTLTIRACVGSTDQTKGDRRVHIQWDTSANNGTGAGTAIIQTGSKTVCQITDRQLSNNACMCPSSPAVSEH